MFRNPYFSRLKIIFGLAQRVHYYRVERKRVLGMQKSVSIKSFTRSLPAIYTHDHLVHMQNGKVYRVYRCGSDRAVYEYMRSQGFDTKEIVRIDLVAPKK